MSTRVSPLLAALEMAWRRAQEHHPDLPAATIVVASPGRRGTGGRRVLGYFAPDRWVAHGAGQNPEVLISGQGLDRGAVHVLGTLLHEAAHALAHARGVKDTSRQGRWHNERFREHASELGLDVEKLPTIGWSGTTVTTATLARYEHEATAIDSALSMLRLDDPAAAPREPRAPRTAPCECACERRIRVPLAELDAGPITCGLCEAPFRRSED